MKYLSEDDLKLVYACEMRSPQQLNMVLTVIDTFGSLTEQLRDKISHLLENA